MRKYKPKKSLLSKPAKKEVSKIAKKAVAKKMEVKLVLGTANTVGLAAATALITDMVPMIQGTTQNTRVGLTISPISCKMRASVTAANNSIVRIIHFRWHPDNAASAPVVGSILDIGVDGINPDDKSFYNYYNRSQYTILSDMFRTLTVNGTQEVFFNKTIKLRGPDVGYNSGAAVTTGENHIYTLIISENAATLDFVNEIRFTDA